MLAAWRALWLVGILALYPGLGIAGEGRRVLLAHSFGESVSPFVDYARQLKAKLSLEHKDLQYHEVAIPDGDANESAIQDISVRTAGHQPDLVITIGGAAALFFQQQRQQVFQSVPLLITAVDERLVDQRRLTKRDAIVATRVELPVIVESILELLPNTTHIAAVVGSSRLEQYWHDVARQEFQRFAGRVEFIWLNKLTLGEIISRSAKLPQNSAIFFGIVWFDAAGVQYAEERPFTAIHAVANAPMFSFSDSYMGRGIVGGPMLPIDVLSQEAADMALRILNGERFHEPAKRVVGFADPVFDWRELQRWKINEARLPPGGLVKFRAPSPWTLYRWQIVSVIALVLAQAALIQWLLTEHRRRRKSEAAAHGLSQKLIAVQEDERSRLARELHDDVTQRLALLAIEAGSGEKEAGSDAGRSTMRSMRRALVRLSEDVHALAYRLHPSLLEDLGLREALKAECDHFMQTCAVRVDLSADESADRVSLDVGLCLFRIVQESLRNIARHASAHQVHVSLRPKDGGLQLMVADDGIGFRPAPGRSGARLGHASMRQRVALLNGTLEIDSKPGWGTVVIAWIPSDRS